MFTSELIGVYVFVEKDGLPSFSWRCADEDEARADYVWFESIKDSPEGVEDFVQMLNDRHPEEFARAMKSISGTWRFTLDNDGDV